MDRNEIHVLEQAYRDAFAILRTEIEQLQAEAVMGSGTTQELDPKAVQRLEAYRTYLSARDALFASWQNDRSECFTVAVAC